MSKSVVIYKSKYGSTKQYAEWISEELKCDIFEKGEITSDNLERYDTIIYGGGLYVGSIIGCSLIKKSFDKIKDKKIIVFTCGIADLNSKENIENIKKDIDSIFDKDIKERITFFHLRGKLDYSNLSLTDKVMMSTLKRILVKKDPKLLTNDDKEILKTYGTKVDYMDRKNIEPIVKFVLNEN